MNLKIVKQKKSNILNNEDILLLFSFFIPFKVYNGQVKRKVKIINMLKRMNYNVRLKELVMQNVLETVRRGTGKPHPWGTA